jgi:hypothetical protein
MNVQRLPGRPAVAGVATGCGSLLALVNRALTTTAGDHSRSLADRTRTGTPPLPQERDDAERARGDAVTALGAQAFTRLAGQGRRMSAQEAAACTPAGDLAQ